MFMGFDIDFLSKLLSSTDSISKMRIIFTSIEEFERVINGGLFSKQKILSVQPVLQVWEKLIDGRNKISGFLVLKGIPQYTFVIVGYEAEVLGNFNLLYEREKFLEILQDSLITQIVEQNVAEEVITLDVIIQNE